MQWIINLLLCKHIYICRVFGEQIHTMLLCSFHCCRKQILLKKKQKKTDDHIINHKQIQCVTHFYLFYFAFFLCVFFLWDG
jgi:hypothetical protein